MSKGQDGRAWTSVGGHVVKDLEVVSCRGRWRAGMRRGTGTILCLQRARHTINTSRFYLTLTDFSQPNLTT